MVPDQSILLILTHFSGWQISPIWVELGDVAGNLLERVYIHLPDVFDQLVNLLDFGLVNNKFITLFKVIIYFRGQVRVFQKDRVHLHKALIVIGISFILLEDLTQLLKWVGVGSFHLFKPFFGLLHCHRSHTCSRSK